MGPAAPASLTQAPLCTHRTPHSSWLPEGKSLPKFPSPQVTQNVFVAVQRCCPISHVSTKPEAGWHVPAVLLPDVLGHLICLFAHPREGQEAPSGGLSGKMGLGHPTACAFPEFPCAVHPTNGFPLPMLRYQAVFPSTSIPARWGCSLATAALECFISTRCSSSLFPLLTSLGQTSALLLSLSSSGEASEETCNSLS